MGISEAERVLLDYVAALDDRDIAAAKALFVEQGTVWVAGHEFSVAEFGVVLDNLGTTFVEIPEYRVLGSFGVGSRAVVEMMVTGRTPADSIYRNQYALVAMVEQGRIVSLHEYLDVRVWEVAFA